jgi:CheY-like chemotaxis protein
VPSVLADATSVQQVLMNLATNSAHAMPHGGLLEIRLEPFYVRDSMARAHPLLREGPHMLLTVRDTGLGMEPAVQARAFEPFFTTKASGGGSGLGLAMVHGIMKDHHGDVQLSSVPGEGTSVDCFFPVSDTAESEAGTSPSAAPRGAGQRILYLDDEVALADVGKRRLIALGYEVAVANDPIRALELLRNTPAAFDLVITDYSMPRMSGVEFARLVMTLRPGLPVVLLTGFLEDFPADRLSEAGVRRLVRKPVTAFDLVQAVHDVLQGA